MHTCIGYTNVKSLLFRFDAHVYRLYNRTKMAGRSDKRDVYLTWTRRRQCLCIYIECVSCENMCENTGSFIGLFLQKRSIILFTFSVSGV